MTPTDASEATVEQALTNALLVLVLTPQTREYLAAHDPYALAQAEAALSFTDQGAAHLAQFKWDHETTAAERAAYWQTMEEEQQAARPLSVREHDDGSWTCRLAVFHHVNKHDDEGCPHMRPGDYDYCRLCAPFQCHHEHDHP